MSINVLLVCALLYALTSYILPKDAVPQRKDEYNRQPRLTNYYSPLPIQRLTLGASGFDTSMLACYQSQIHLGSLLLCLCFAV